mgnify:CR=1 FL=1
MCQFYKQTQKQNLFSANDLQPEAVDESTEKIITKILGIDISSATLDKSRPCNFYMTNI